MGNGELSAQVVGGYCLYGVVVLLLSRGYEKQVKEAEDADDPKAAFIDLILSAVEESDNSDALRKELEGMKRSALRDRAAESGADKEALEEADDADDIIKYYSPFSQP